MKWIVLTVALGAMFGLGYRQGVLAERARWERLVRSRILPPPPDEE